MADCWTVCLPDYTYEEFCAEWEEEKTGEELYREDCRRVAEHNILQGATYEAGGVPDQQFLTVI